MEFMDVYGLTKDDREALLERAEHFGQSAPAVPTAIKTAFTKRFGLLTLLALIISDLMQNILNCVK